MTVQISTAFKTRLLAGEGFASLFDQGCVRIYSGLPPATADAAVQGTLLATMTLDGQPWLPNGSDGGLIFQQFGAWMAKPDAAVWRINVTASGVAGWFRLVGPALDDGGVSNVSPRTDGVVSNDSAADFYLVNPVLTAGQVLAVQQFSFTFPPVA